MKILFAFFLAFLSGSVGAQTVFNGHWYDPSQSGRGMNVDHQNDVMVVDFYGYNSDGSAQWHQASGKTSFDKNTLKITFSAPMLRYRNGQCLTCNYSGAPVSDGDDGTINITFLSPTQAEVTLPGGGKTIMTPYYFGINRGAKGMAGGWIFSYLKDNKFNYANMFFSEKITENGVDIIFSSDGKFACSTEVNTKNNLMVCFEINNSNRIVTYFRAYLAPDKTYYGIASENQNFTSSDWFTGYRTSWPNGSDKSLLSEKSDIMLSQQSLDKIKNTLKEIARQ